MASYGEEEVAHSRGPQRRGADGSARKLRARAIAFMLVALAAGLSAAWLISTSLRRQVPKTVSMPLVKVAVAASDIALATAIRAEMIALVDWPEGNVPAGSNSDVAQLIGRVTATQLLKGEVLAESRLALPGAGQGMAAIIPADMRAMTVRVNEVIGVGGFVHPGDIVDVVTTMQAPPSRGSNVPEYRSKIVLQAIAVLAVGEDMMTRNSKPIKVPVVTLLVTPEQSERLALASTHGELQLTMRSQRDRSEVETDGVSPPDLLGPHESQLAASGPATPRGRRYIVPPVLAAVPPAQDQTEVIEVLHGDRREERRVKTKERQ